MEYVFQGKWITDAEFAPLEPRRVFHRQLEPFTLEPSAHRNRHVLFRKKLTLPARFERAVLRFSADDYAKVYVNGRFVTQGPAPAYHFQYGFVTADVTEYLRPGENLLAFHTYYQGLVNRVWVSGDDRHGLLCDLEVDGRVLLGSDESFLTSPHTGFRALAVTGYDTQFMEEYDASAPEVGFERPDYDDSAWVPASPRRHVDYTVVPQKTKCLEFETIRPSEVKATPEGLRVDFGKTCVGTLTGLFSGKKGEKVEFFYGQELEGEAVRWRLRANCAYHDSLLLSGGEDRLSQYDYKSFRWVTLVLPEGCGVRDLALEARHYPFAQKAALRAEYRNDPDLTAIWELCVNTLRYGVQEVIQDCMEREKGFYVGDGCYTSLAHFLVTGDDSIVRKLIDDAFTSSFITPGLVTCLDCSLMQEIAEYPFMLFSLILWHYRLTGDRAYLAGNYPKLCRVLDEYRRRYETDGLLGNLDKWCVVDWPEPFRDGYDVDVTEGRVCVQPHVVMNAYYLEAIRVANAAAAELGLPPYRDDAPLKEAFLRAFYDPERRRFRDGTRTEHVSLIGNVIPFGFGLVPAEAAGNVLGWIRERGIENVSFFGAFVLLEGLIRAGREDLLREQLLRPGAWKRMLREGATTTYEGWGRDTKWNTSLFHLTMSDAAVFLSDTDLGALFR